MDNLAYRVFLSIQNSIILNFIFYFYFLFLFLICLKYYLAWHYLYRPLFHPQPPMIAFRWLTLRETYILFVCILYTCRNYMALFVSRLEGKQLFNCYVCSYYDVLCRDWWHDHWLDIFSSISLSMKMSAPQRYSYI
jgi:hypothetical protein